ncbi:MAG: glycosyltransferase family 2 protein [Thermoguttaceae bacterium]|nr:glycosyltransferase family 2 protein [Thermoguttaceae bacterium]
MPAISVIITVYNVEPYLRECLDSVVNQTFRDLEIICVDDGSTDGSPAILDEYAAKDGRFVVIHQKNAGQASAKETGLSRVTGEYFTFVDSDDWIDARAYEKAYARAKESGADMTQFSFKWVNYPNHKDVPLPNIEETANQTERIQWAYTNTSVCWCYLWKTDFARRVQLHFHKDAKCDDIAFTFKGAVFANKFAFIPERLYFYRFRTSSLTGNANKSKYYLQAPQAFTLLFQDIAPYSVTDESWLALYSIKWGILYDAYNFLIDKSIRPEMRRCIKQSVTNDERRLITANAKSFDLKTYGFFLKFSGLTILRWKYNCKVFKGKCFDWFAKRLIPYSPWLQHTLEIVDRQRDQIQKLQEELENSKDE